MKTRDDGKLEKRRMTIELVGILAMLMSTVERFKGRKNNNASAFRLCVSFDSPSDKQLLQQLF